MKSTLSLVVMAAVILLFLILLSSGRKAPGLPADDLHKDVSSDASCAPCHGAGGKYPLKAGHPPKEQCLICHKPKT